MKLTAYFSDLTHTGNGVNSREFPLGIGTVAAYAKEHLSEFLSVNLFKFPKNLNKAIMESPPHFLCMTNWCANKSLSYAFAEFVKKNHPETIVIWGGPNFPTRSKERIEFLHDHPYVDFYVKWDGEVAFVELISELMKCDLKIDVFKSKKLEPINCCYLIGNDYVEGADHKIKNINEVPSPYLTGLFDKFFKMRLDPLVELTRGCPYQCTFCNDGHSFKTYVVRKSADLIKKEIEYIAERTQVDKELGICADNYGMFKEDLEISQIISDTIKKYNWPKVVSTSNGKSQPERVLESRRIINQHNEGTMRFGASLQSTDPDVLKNIRRKNLPLDKLTVLKDERHKTNTKADFFTELILGLPGDTLPKHFESLRYAIDVIGISNLDIHQLNLVYGAELNEQESIKTYEMNIRYRVFVNCFGIYEIGKSTVPCAEIDKTVVGNKTLPYEDYLECRIMNLLIKIFFDHDPFKEITGVIRHLGLSLFELLIIIKDELIPKNNNLNRLISEFIEKTEKPLYKSYEDLKSLLTSSKIVGDYISGKRGGNELLNCKAKAFLSYTRDLHLVISEAACIHMNRNGQKDPLLKEYIEQAAEFSFLRKFDANEFKGGVSDQITKYGSFTFDFQKAMIFLLVFELHVDADRPYKF